MDLPGLIVMPDTALAVPAVAVSTAAANVTSATSRFAIFNM